MTTPISLFVELCAGTAALSLRLHRDGAKPPVSRMGAKTGYANAILRILGLAPGQRAAGYLWCEPDPGVRLLLHAYRDATLARAAAAIIRGWAAEDPRALWERLRAEGPPRLPEGGADAGEVARWQVLSAWAFRKGAPESGFNAGYVGARPPTATEHSHLGRSAADEARMTERMPTALPATIHPDAREVDPREVARWAHMQGVGVNGKGASAGFGGWERPFRAHGEVVNMLRQDGHPEVLAPRLDRLPDGIEATIHPDARDIDPPALPPGTVCYMDPPYVATTGYGHDLPRAEVVALARRWAAAGATVAISEAEPIPELVAEGWHAVRIDGERVGQKRTFSRQQAEWLTLNRTPAWVPPVQVGLFGGGR